MPRQPPRGKPPGDETRKGSSRLDIRDGNRQGVLLLPLWSFPPFRARAAPTTPPAMIAMPPGVRQNPPAFSLFPSRVQAYPLTGLSTAATFLSTPSAATVARERG